jgi:hypothetical protein
MFEGTLRFEEYYLLGWDVVLTHRNLLAFQKSEVRPSSRSKDKSAIKNVSSRQSYSHISLIEVGS